jgi:acetyl-CoA carboxylase biotin carboxyl carrier protein
MRCSAMELTHEDVKKILELIDGAQHLDEIEVVYGGFHLRVHRAGSSEAGTRARASAASAASASAPATHTSAPVPAPPRPAERAESTLDQGEIAVRAPMLGTFYRAQSPGAPPFVEPGQRVKADDVVGLIEVMKLFNSIRAGVDGVVTRVLVENGALVEYNQALIAVSTVD